MAPIQKYPSSQYFIFHNQISNLLLNCLLIGQYLLSRKTLTDHNSTIFLDFFNKCCTNSILKLLSLKIYSFWLLGRTCKYNVYYSLSCILRVSQTFLELHIRTFQLIFFWCSCDWQQGFACEGAKSSSPRNGNLKGVTGARTSTLAWNSAVLRQWGTTAVFHLVNPVRTLKNVYFD